MIDPFEATVFLVVPAVLGLLAGGVLWLQARSTRAFDAKWGTTAASEDSEPQTKNIVQPAGKSTIGVREPTISHGAGC
jgi:hypothetical protein